MSKKLKLTALSTSRSLRSNQRINDVTFSKESPYFDQKNDHSSMADHVKNNNSTEIQNKTDDEIMSEAINESKKSKNKKVTKKRSVPLKIEYEELNEIEQKGKSDKEFLMVKINKEKDEKLDKVENTSGWIPSNWKRMLENIQEMRKYKTAPVDEMGCHKCPDPNATDSIFRYQCLLALMLSSQTKDQITHAAMKRLISYGCIPSTIIATPNDVLVKLIQPVGFANRKAEYIKRTSVILMDKYNGDIPKTIKELCELPGVGPKMAHICMQIAWGEISGIGVDTHVHRICNRLNWVKKPTKTPEETRKELEEWLPKDLWNEINHLLVGFGQEICLPRFPKCKECLNKDICPSVGKK
ncbi:endonuclease III-like protein 1 [Vespa mandarinia]|uniref:endonuclease III-like protein 1 n=1 Tax=Vespa mandarinia TaxID=7446 RepID=UPI001618C596|nr:endonuclease III-like protein 1 [Vespa mandarinia]